MTVKGHLVNSNSYQQRHFDYKRSLNSPGAEKIPMINVKMCEVLKNSFAVLVRNTFQNTKNVLENDGCKSLPIKMIKSTS